MAGREIHFGGKTWTVGPLNWEQLSRIYPDLGSLHRIGGAEQVITRLRVIVAALVGQAPEAELRSLPTDLAEIYAASEIIGDLSGFVRLGELVAERARSSTTGTPSSPPPAPIPAGADATSDS